MVSTQVVYNSKQIIKSACNFYALDFLLILKHRRRFKKYCRKKALKWPNYACHIYKTLEAILTRGSAFVSTVYTEVCVVSEFPDELWVWPTIYAIVIISKFSKGARICVAKVLNRQKVGRYLSRYIIMCAYNT